MILDDLLENKLIFEAHGRKLYFDYTKIRKGMEETTNPVVFYLGTWRRKLKSGVRRTYWCGIDMNNLDEEQLAALQHELPNILKKRSVYDRYWAGKRLLPDIFHQFYRTYNTNSVGAVIKGRLFSLDVTDVDKEEAAKLAVKDGGPDWEDLSNNHKSYYTAQAVRKRGTREAEEQEKAAAEKEEEPEKVAKPDLGDAAPPDLPKDFVPINPAIQRPKVKPRPEQVPPTTQATKHSIIQPSPQRLRPSKPAPIEDDAPEE